MPSNAAQSSVNTVSSAAEVRTIVFKDLTDAINKGIDDFNAKPSHPLFVALVYPAAMAIAIAFTLNLNLIPLAFPIISGAAVLGPGVAVGLYELSRRREAGEEVTWLHAFSVPSQPVFPRNPQTRRNLVGDISGVDFGRLGPVQADHWRTPAGNPR